MYTKKIKDAGNLHTLRNFDAQIREGDRRQSDSDTRDRAMLAAEASGVKPRSLPLIDGTEPHCSLRDT